MKTHQFCFFDIPDVAMGIRGGYISYTVRRLDLVPQNVLGGAGYVTSFLRLIQGSARYKGICIYFRLKPTKGK